MDFTASGGYPALTRARQGHSRLATRLTAPPIRGDTCHSLTMADAKRDEIPPGTLYMLILRMLARHGALHGYEIANAIQQVSEDVLQVEEGSLYPALQRMLLKRWVTAEWGVTAGNRRARYYRLTTAGSRQLNAEMKQYQRVTGAIQKILLTA